MNFDDLFFEFEKVKFESSSLDKEFVKVSPDITNIFFFFKF